MNNVGQSVKCMMIAAVLGLMPGIASQAVAKPLKVFILAGQSNMQGHARVSTFGSAKILGGVGKGLAEAMAELKQFKQLKKIN
jgi:hypothetical protein